MPPGHRKHHSILPGCLRTSANIQNFVFIISDVSCCFSENLANTFSYFLNISLKVMIGPCGRRLCVQVINKIKYFKLKNGEFR